MALRPWRIGALRNRTLGGTGGTPDITGTLLAPIYSGATASIVQQAIFDGMSARLAVTLDSATLASTAEVGEAAVNLTLAVTLDSATLNSEAVVYVVGDLSLTLDAATLAAAAQALALAGLGVQLDDATLASDVDALVAASLALTLDDATFEATSDPTAGASLALTLDDATLTGSWSADSANVFADETAPTADGFASAARIAVLVQANASVALDDATLSSLLNTTGTVYADLAVTLADATLSSLLVTTAPPVPVALPVRGGSGRRKGGAVGPPVYVGTYQVEPRKVVARAALAAEDATAAATVELGRVARLAIALDSCTMRATVEVNWLDVIADDDALLTLLAAA